MNFTFSFRRDRLPSFSSSSFFADFKYVSYQCQPKRWRFDAALVDACREPELAFHIFEGCLPLLSISRGTAAVIHPGASCPPTIFAISFGLEIHIVGLFSLPCKTSACPPATPNVSAPVALSAPGNTGNRYRQLLQRAAVSNVLAVFPSPAVYDVRRVITDVSAIAR